ncbi:MAG: hypothetical protein ABI894_09655 [Ilumatobacteraceae bacterium]
MTDRPSDDAIWASVADTLRKAVLPHISDPQARTAATHLIGLATYASRRGPNPIPNRLEQLTSALGGAAGQDVMRSCFAVLADPHHSAHEELREILERHLEEDIESEAALLEARRGQVPRG